MSAGQMHCTVTTRSPPSSSKRIYGDFHACSLIPGTCSTPIAHHLAIHRPPPTKLQLVTPHANKVINIWNLRQHNICCSHLEKSPIEHEEELQKGSKLQSATEIQGSLGVSIALALLSFYRREISPFLPRTCRYVPTCSEYSMQAYQRYGVTKGTILTAWRLLRCNPFGSSGFDPPRWFGESEAPID